MLFHGGRLAGVADASLLTGTEDRVFDPLIGLLASFSTRSIRATQNFG
jgi:hypothetical protein